MRRRGLSLLAAAGLLFLSGRGLAALSEKDSGEVVTVYDGDTVRVRFGDGTLRKVRLIGIDSPELSDSREAVRFMALMAKRFAFRELFRKEVRLAYDWQLEDKYGRLLAYLYEGDGSLFNERILREGFASVLRAFPYDDTLRKRFESAEKEAREGERGLWRKGRPPEILPGAARDHLGRLVSIRMTCSRIEERGAFTVLHGPDDGFEVLVPKADRPS
ncbi:MAG: thermonuclease family protein, partial [Candidatus Aminicenantales bacterium]